MTPRTTAVAAVVLALAMVVSSTAFTAVSAERTAVVEVVGDADAAIVPSPHDGPNGVYAYFDDGLFVVDVSGSNPNGGPGGPGFAGQGVGPNALTRFDGVFDDGFLLVTDTFPKTLLAYVPGAPVTPSK